MIRAKSEAMIIFDEQGHWGVLRFFPREIPVKESPFSLRIAPFPDEDITLKDLTDGFSEPRVDPFGGTRSSKEVSVRGLRNLTSFSG